jgi:antitoxin CptB
MTEPVEIRRKRLLFRSWHRGTREADLLLGPFAARHLGEFSPADLDRYEALLSESDTLLYDWLSARTPPPAEHGDMLSRIRAFRRQPSSA